MTTRQDTGAEPVATSGVAAGDPGELASLRAMRRALARMASDHQPECCGYCRHVRKQIDAVLAVAPMPTDAIPNTSACEKWRATP